MTLQPFELTQVRLLDGPFKAAQEANRRYLHDLDADRLLYCFRQNAGLPTPGTPLGGWEAPSCEVRGHFVGHYLSACALMYASTGDTGLKEKADAMVAEMAKCQTALGEGYLSAYPKTFWDRLESLQGPPWAPYYTMHKIMAGLFDVYRLCGNQQALDVLKGMAGYFKGRIDKLPIYQWDKILDVEFGGMAEVCYNLYSVTGDPQHAQLAHYFDKAAFLGPLALEHDNLSRIHANTHIPEIVAAARRYELFDDKPYRTAVEFFWDRIVNARMYATGGTSNHEMWPDPRKLDQTLSAQNQESCTSYNMLRVTRHLILWTGGTGYGDYYERTLFNSILGTQNPKDGMLAYFTPLAPGYAKVFGTPNDAFWCCYGTGIESFSKLGDSIYFHDALGVYVNLFIPSELDWKEQGVRVEQQTRFPDEDSTVLTIHAAKPKEFAVSIRIPAWTHAAELSVNGNAIPDAAIPGKYARLQRVWHEGDSVRLRMPMTIHAEALPDNAHVVAPMYGPIVLAGISQEPRYILGDAAKPETWLRKIDAPTLRFESLNQPETLDFVALNQVIEDHYGVYWEVVEKGSARHKQLQAEEDARRKFEARVIDRVTPVEASEKAHDFQGELTQAGAYGGKNWRHATAGGWWSWKLKVLPDKPAVLRCTYWGDDVPPRAFDILAGDAVIGTQSLNRDKPGEFFFVDYPLPADVLKGKNELTIKFRPHDNNTAGGVFECVTLKPQ